MKKIISLLFCLYIGSANAALINGGFETGDFSGWNASGGTSGCSAPYTVNSSGTTGCTPVATPSEGNFAAYNAFDGVGPFEFTLSQSFNVVNGLTSANLTWEHVFEVEESSNTSLRTFSVDFFDSSNALISNIFSHQMVQGTNSSNGWNSISIDVTQALSNHIGQNVFLQFTNIIPLDHNGPAGFGLDNVNLNLNTNAVPEPSVLWLLGSSLIGLIGMRKKSGKLTGNYA